jgi:hypothetical protein
VRRVQAQDTSPHYKRCARFDIAGALTSQGIVFADLTAEALLDYATETRLNRYGKATSFTSAIWPGRCCTRAVIPAPRHGNPVRCTALTGDDPDRAGRSL